MIGQKPKLGAVLPHGSRVDLVISRVRPMRKLLAVAGGRSVMFTPMSGVVRWLG